MSDEIQIGGERGDLFVLSAPSGAGKTTLIHGMMHGLLAEYGGIAFSVSHTTRAPRDGEVGGRDYNFVDPAEFQRMVDTGEFLEWAEVHGNRYGTSRQEVVPRLATGVDVVLDLDVQGTERLIARFPEAHSIFILPPSYADLERRLSGRGLDRPDEMARRLAVSLWEIRRFEAYDYVIINDDAERASRALGAIILEKRHLRERMRGRVEAVVADFERARRS